MTLFGSASVLTEANRAVVVAERLDGRGYDRGMRAKPSDSTRHFNVATIHEPCVTTRRHLVNTA